MGWLLLRFIYCSYLGIKNIRRVNFLCIFEHIFHPHVLFFIRDYAAPILLETVIPSNMIENGKFCLSIKKLVVPAKVQIHQQS